MRQELITLRERAGLTQEDVASRVGVSRSFYGHIETGMRNPTYGLAKKIASVFDTTVDSIFFDPDGFRMKQNKAAI